MFSFNKAVLKNTALKSRGLILAVTFLSSCFLSSCTGLMDRDAPEISEAHYRIYKADGSESSLEELVSESKASTVTFLGETHDDPVAHYLEALILEKVWDEKLSLSLEMFESDVQYVVDEYLADLIREDHLLKSGRAWDNYDSDYKPMIEFMKENKGSVIAANAPRRYVNMVSRLGAESLLQLSDQAKAWLPPLPYAEASMPYAEKFNTLMEENRPNASEKEQENISEEERQKAEQEKRDSALRNIQAQSLWDASMAYSISQHLYANPDARVLHVNGSFHTAENMGILDHLRRYRPDSTTLVITMISVETFPVFDAETMLNQGDFVIVTEASVTGN